MSKEIAPELLAMLACPVSKGPLIYDKKNQELISKEAGLAYKIKDGVPIMLPDLARKIVSTNKKMGGAADISNRAKASKTGRIQALRKNLLRRKNGKKSEKDDAN